jgi:hypothetical protein
MSPLTCQQVLDEIDLLAAGECDPGTAAAIWQHVTGCPGCAAALEQARQVIGWVNLSVREPQALERLQQRIHAEARQRRPARGLLVLRVAGVAAMLLLTIGLYFVLSPGLDQDRHGHIAMAQIGPSPDAVYRVEDAHSIRVISGELLVRVTPEQAPGQAFTVHTAGGTVTAERAEFVVEAAGKNPLSVRVLSGKVSVDNNNVHLEARRGETLRVSSARAAPQRLIESPGYRIARAYVPVKVKAHARVPALKLPVEPAAVWNWPSLVKGPGTLRTQGSAVVGKGESDDLVSSYDVLSKQGMPLMITSDTVLYLARAQLANLLRDLEEHQLAFDLTRLTEGLGGHLAHPQAARERTASYEGRQLALIYVAVAQRLLHPEAEAPQGVDAAVLAAIVKAVQEGQKLEEVPGLGYGADFSDFRPVGHYAASDTLQRYFRATMWLSRMPLLVAGGEGKTVSALQAERQTIAAHWIAEALQQAILSDGRPAVEAWRTIDTVASFFAGAADQPGPAQYTASRLEWRNPFASQLMQYVPRPLFADVARSVRQPVVPEDLKAEVGPATGFCLLSQRFAADAFALGKLVYPNIGRGTNEKAFTAVTLADGQIVRGLPRGLDLMALQGNSFARRVLHDGGDDAYQATPTALGYDEAFDRLRADLDRLDVIDWNRDLYWAWLYALQPLLREPIAGSPTFMTSGTYQVTQMNSALASWTQLRGDTVLYTSKANQAAGQFRAESKDARAFTPGPQRGTEAMAYVEPLPELYARLLALTQMASKELAKMNLLTAEWQKRLAETTQLFATAYALAEKELDDEPLGAEEQAELRRLPERLREASGGPLPGPVIVTIAKAASGDWVLQEATGRPDLGLFLVRLPDGKLATFAGPLSSYYEFKQRRIEALTPERWQEMLRATPGPVRPEWAR